METRVGLRNDGGDAVPLIGVEVRAEVVAGYACATVRQRYKNTETRAIEATYIFPLPTKAVVTGFAMVSADRRLEGMVQEKEDAFRRYDEAIAAGHGAALLEQARPNVFSALIGNLLPGEELTVEIQYVEPVFADEGAVRWSIPTLVAPRYISASVTDAEKVTPPMRDTAYGLDLEVHFDLGANVTIASPSHALSVNGNRASLSAPLLDRDVVITALAVSGTAGAPIASSVSHRRAGEQGTVAVMVVPDLGATKTASAARSVVFLLDRSGSMGGTSILEARSALALCLRQLREGDRFNILAFDNTIAVFEPTMVPYGPATLARADAWIQSVDARGGTEIMAPLLEAARLAPDGLIVLLTDGEVANEAEIVDAFMAARGSARVYSFGIGSNVSDALLHALADKTGGAVAHIHPGERIDEKVSAQFARATAARITNVSIKTRGIDLGEIAPAPDAGDLTLVDGEPFSLFATYTQSGRGAVEIRGKRDGENFYLEVPVDLEAESERPAIEKLWAQARIRDLEKASTGTRRAETMKERIVKLAQTYGVSSKHTSFVVVDKRQGDRRMNAMPESRVVPVAAPAGWDMYSAARTRSYGQGGQTRAGSLTPRPGAGAAPPMAMRCVAPPRAMGMRPSTITGAAPPMRGAPAPIAMPASRMTSPPGAASMDPITTILRQQDASGLWPSLRDPIAATVDALLALVRIGVSTQHMIYGAQIKKGVEALLARVTTNRTLDVKLRELALGVCWLITSGPRTRGEIEMAAKGSALAVHFSDELAVRAHVERLAA